VSFPSVRNGIVPKFSLSVEIRGILFLAGIVPKFSPSVEIRGTFLGNPFRLISSFKILAL